MAHYAQVNSDNIVVQVLVMNNDWDHDNCITWLEANVSSSDDWIQTSYNHRIRKQFAGIGFTYDSTKDIFIAPKPFASWSLDSDNDWQPPVAMPDDASADKMYKWDEDVYNADNSKGWVLIE